MKKIYLVLTHTGTVLSRVIKSYTNTEFSHVSISLDSELKELYSFGRLNPNNPFIGGFVHEGIDHGTFKKFSNTQTAIYSLYIENYQYEIISRKIENFKKNKEKYKFNIIGLFAVAVHKKITFKKSFYCAEFVKYLLDEAKIQTNLPEMIKPIDFKDIEGVELEYKGLLKEYSINYKNLVNVYKNGFIA